MCKYAQGFKEKHVHNNKWKIQKRTSIISRNKKHKIWSEQFIEWDWQIRHYKTKQKMIGLDDITI